MERPRQRDLAPIGQIWIGALRLVVIPLVVTQTLTAVAGVRREASVAALAGRAILTRVTARGAGAAVGGFLLFYTALVCGVLLLETALLYPVTALFARVSVWRFARAVAPAQLVAAGSRSSNASLPALVEGAQDGLGLPPMAAGFLLPFSVALFKLNRTASSAVRLLLLAHVVGISLHPAQLLVFLATEMVISVSAIGVPGGGGQMRGLPAYLALGIPIEGILLLEAVDDVPDVFKTVTNVTGDMSVAAILCRPKVASEAA